MLTDELKAGLGQDLVPAGLRHPEAVLALVGEGPGARVEAPDQSRHAAREVVQQQESALGQRRRSVVQRVCDSSQHSLRMTLQQQGDAACDIM